MSTGQNNISNPKSNSDKASTKFKAKLPENWDGSSPIHVWISEKIEVVVFKRKGELNVFQSICPHMGGQLTYNSKTDTISCPWHPLDFNLKTTKSTHHKFKSICRYNAIIEDGHLLVLR